MFRCRIAVMLGLWIAFAGVPVFAQPVAEIDEQHSWTFEPKDDPFDDSALLDLRSLNEKRSGESGFVRLSSDGDGFVLGNGKPVRFWACGSDMYRRKPEEMDLHCRFLAKRGVNMVRLHATICDTKGSDIEAVNEKEIDGIFRFIKSAKDNGIYVTISPYYAMFDTPGSWNLEGVAGQKPWGVLFVNERLQKAYKHWVRELYTRKNPYTGLAIKDDPTVAILQIQNEDSLFFWTTQQLPSAQVRLLIKQYAAWLKAKYGSLQIAKAAWGNATLGDGAGNAMGKIGDDWQHDVVGLYIVWELTQDQKGDKARRITDQTTFLAEFQRKFYDDMAAYLRKDLGCKQLINACNWKTASQERLDDIERWTYAGCDVIAVNRYTGGEHAGANNGYRIDPGHHIVNRSVLRHPDTLPTNLKQIAGHPMMITETSWVNPNLYQVEGPLLVSAYQSIGGVDIVFWFSATEPTWELDPRRTWWKVGDSYALSKWSCSTPTLMGMFPANALMYRMGYINPMQPSVIEQRTKQDLMERQPAKIVEDPGFDPNRDAANVSGQGKNANALSFLSGPVREIFDAAKGGIQVNPNTVVQDHVLYLDSDRQTSWDFQHGLFTMQGWTSHPLKRKLYICAVAAAGFFDGKPVNFHDAQVICHNDYAAINIVSMDDQPLTGSAKILVQVGTKARLTGWLVQPETFKEGTRTIDGLRIVNTGHPPYRIEDTQATVMVNNPAITRATLLDVNGYAVRDVAVKRDAKSVTVELPGDGMYVVLRK